MRDTFTIPLPEKLPADICTEIAKRSCYCDDRIVRSSYSQSDNTLVVVASDDDISDVLAGKINRLIDKMKSDRLAVKPKKLRDRAGSSTKFDISVFEQLADLGDVSLEDVGVISRSGEFLDLLQSFDTLFQHIGSDLFSAKKMDYNTLIPSDWLRGAGYFSSFAHSVTFATHLREDYSQLEDFAERHRDGQSLSFNSIDELTTPEYCLSPAVCYHAYGGLKGSQFTPDDNGLKVLTAMGRCFRMSK